MGWVGWPLSSESEPIKGFVGALRQVREYMLSSGFIKDLFYRAQELPLTLCQKSRPYLPSYNLPHG